ncbi:MAG: DMT family transporter, partial [Rhodospirillales bacterium]|nr:DMT family transporter [Rhodospirillales bacterium]
EIVFFRNFFGLVFMLPWLANNGLGALKTRRLGLYSVRAVLNVVAMLAAFSALAMMPIADAMALSFTAPLFGTVLAALALAEVVRLRRWAATVVGFLGAMLILRPGFGEMNPAALLALVGAAAVAATGIVIKMLSRTESVNAIVAYMVIFLTPMSLVPALFVWTAPGLEALLWLAILGGLGTLAHIGVTRAFKTADASLVLPFDFVRLPFAALIGYAAFDERPDAWTWTAAAVIAAATLYVARSEAKAAGAVTGAAAAPDRSQR